MNTITDKNCKSELAKRKATVLLIDNEMTVLNLIHEMLEELGYSVISFYQESEALTNYKNVWKEIDIVAVGIQKSESDNRLKGALININPGVKILFYNREQVAAGLYIYNVEYEGFNSKIDYLMNN